jgi:hypothetical protein
MMGSFDDGLWARLVEEHGADRVTFAEAKTTRRSRPVIFAAGAGAVAAAAATALVIVGTTSAPPAYAVTEAPDGTVTITLNDVVTGIPGVNARLQQLGIRAMVVPVQSTCTQDVIPGSSAPSYGFFVVGSSSAQNTWTIRDSDIPPGQNELIAARQSPDGNVGLAIAQMSPPLPTCFPDLQGTIGGNPWGDFGKTGGQTTAPYNLNLPDATATNTPTTTGATSTTTTWDTSTPSPGS